MGVRDVHLVNGSTTGSSNCGNFSIFGSSFNFRTIGGVFNLPSLSMRGPYLRAYSHIFSRG